MTKNEPPEMPALFILPKRRISMPISEGSFSQDAKSLPVDCSNPSIVFASGIVFYRHY